MEVWQNIFESKLKSEIFRVKMMLKNSPRFFRQTEGC